MIGGSRSLAVLLASLMLASPALGGPRPPSEKERQIASDLVKKAIARSQAGDHGAAIEIYLQAYTLVPNSLLLSNIGAEFQQQGMWKEALNYFCMYLDKDPSGTNAPYATAQARILQRQLGNKQVDDRDVCAPPAPAEPARDRAQRDRTGRDAPEDPPETPPAEHPPAAAPGGSRALMFTGLAVGIAGLAAAGIGAYEGIQAKDISDQISNHDPATPWPDNIRDLENRGQRYENLQIGYLIASGVLVTSGVVLFLVGRPDRAPDRHGDQAAIRVTPTAGGFAVSGRF